MGTEIIGHVTSGKTRNQYTVKWDAASRDVYVSYAGWSRCREKADTAAHAMRIAEAYLYDK